MEPESPETPDEAAANAEAPPATEAAAPVTTRTIITGSPYAGMPDLAAAVAATFGIGAKHTDDTMGMEWSAASALVATWFDAPGPWVVEGVAAPRALRKWLAAHPDRADKPCDVLRFVERPLTALTPRQEGMRKSVATVFAEIRAELEARGVEIVNE